MNLQEFSVFPAIHLRNGKVIRYTQGDLSNPTIYHEDPVTCAKTWIDQGAQWLQVVNLDAAFNEDASHNWELIEKICQLGVNIQFGGGIRSMADIDWAMKSGIKRVMIATAAVEQPQFVADAVAAYGSNAIALAIDTNREGEVLTHGWTTAGGIEAVTLGVQMRHLGVTTAVHTSIHRDGSMTGTDLEKSVELAQMTGLNVIVGGGVGSLDDLLDCYNQPGIGGAIIGKSLYTGKVQLSKALHVSQQKIAFETGLPQWKADQQTPWVKLSYELSHTYLNKHLPDKMKLKVLDAGGGNGLDSLRLAKQEHHIDLVDISQAMLADQKSMAQQAGVGDYITDHLMDIRQIHKKFPQDTFDLVLCHNVLQYSDDLISMLQSLLAPLKPGGLFSLITLNQHALTYQAAIHDNDLHKALELLNTKRPKSSIFGTSVREYKPESLINWLELNHFTVEAHYGLGCLYHHPKIVAADKDMVFYDHLHQLELALANQDPHKQMARYMHIIAHKNP